MSFLFLPRPSQKTEPIFLFLLNLSNLHNMFRLSPWSHGIWFKTDKNNVDHKKLSPTFTFSRTHWEKMKAGQKWVKNINPSGVTPSLPLSLSSFVLEPLLVEKPPPMRLLSTGARTPPSNCDPPPATTITWTWILWVVSTTPPATLPAPCHRSQKGGTTDQPRTQNKSTSKIQLVGGTSLLPKKKHLLDFPPLCVFKCVLKLPTR